MKKIKKLRLLALAGLLAVSFVCGKGFHKQGENDQAVFFELPRQVQTELLAGAIALLSQPEDGYAVRLTIGGVLLNRLALPQWGDTLEEVTGGFLYGGVSEIPKAGDAGAMVAASDALRGHMPVPGATRFGVGEPPEEVENAVEFGGYWFGS